MHHKHVEIIPDPPLNSINFHLLLMKQDELQRRHHSVIIAGIVTSDPSNLS